MSASGNDVVQEQFRRNLSSIEEHVPAAICYCIGCRIKSDADAANLVFESNVWLDWISRHGYMVASIAVKGSLDEVGDARHEVRI